jgi:hypothetical protein
LRGFEAGERAEAEKKKRTTPASGRSPIPSCSGIRRGSVDPLAKARFDWNAGIRAEYKAKFEKWTKMKKEAEKNGMAKGNYIIYTYRFIILLKKLVKV